MPSATFSLAAHLAPDFNLPENWSDDMVPGAGTAAVIGDATVLVDPGTSLTAEITLQANATLAGNGGAFSLADGSALVAEGADAVFADGALVNDGPITVAGPATSLLITVDNGAIPQGENLSLPSFRNAGQIEVSGGATLTVAGTELSNIGGIIVDGATFFVTGGGIDGGQGKNTPPGGEILLTDHADAIVTDGVADQTIDFAGAGTLTLDDIGQTDNVTINGFDAQSTLLLPNFGDAVRALTALTFENLPQHTAPVAVATAGGAEILLEPVPPCFARGTWLLTPGGYVKVEALKPGDPIVTAAGDVRPVRWIGMRTLDIATHTRPDAVRPIRILAGALAPNVPARPVRLSPDHALFLRGRLVPAKLLVNGATILREYACQAVTYYHVELDRHDILLADNLPVESYLDTGNRNMFATTSGIPRNNPYFGRGRQWDSSAYADLCLGGAMLRDIRRHIHRQALDLGYRTRILTEVALWSDGQKYRPVAGAATRPVFRFPGSHSGRIGIRSARFVPAEMAAEAPASEGEDDYRVLGIAISRIRVGLHPVPPARIAVSGFHPRAPGETADWTDGYGVIDVPSDTRTVSLRIEALPQGWLTPTGAAVPAY